MTGSPTTTSRCSEPQVLPARFPNLLVNGSSGIAVGMATNIPPHNLGEAVEAACMLIDNPEATTVDELMTVMPGPDFPTGAVIMGTSGIREAYETGRGSITVRAKAHVESTKTGRNRLVFTEIPYQVNKGTLQEKIAQLVNEKRLEGISDLRDESNQQGHPPGGGAQEGRHPAGRAQQPVQVHRSCRPPSASSTWRWWAACPSCLSLREMLQHYIDHQVDVVTRRTQLRPASKAKARAHILEGYLHGARPHRRGHQHHPLVAHGLRGSPSA